LIVPERVDLAVREISAMVSELEWEPAIMEAGMEGVAWMLANTLTAS
jgi:hypothetical protein